MASWNKNSVKQGYCETKVVWNKDSMNQCYQIGKHSCKKWYYEAKITIKAKIVTNNHIMKQRYHEPMVLKW